MTRLATTVQPKPVRSRRLSLTIGLLAALGAMPAADQPNFLLGADTIRFTGSTITVRKDSAKFDTSARGQYYGGATDSASSGTAIACGFKTEDGNIAWLPGDPASGGNRPANNGSLKSIAEIVREGAAPKSIGVITTVQFSHATPAVFVAHNVLRGNYWQIGDEVINVTKPEVVIGAGHPTWEGKYDYVGPTKSTSDTTNYTRLKDGSAGYTFVERKAGVTTAGADLKTASSTASKLFGLFGGSAGYMEPPVPTGSADSDGKGGFSIGSAENPSLSDSTQAAINVLSKNRNGFFLMVEGGDIDWANHVDSYKWMLGAMKQFDDALRLGQSLVDAGTAGMSWSNTLFIVAADHGNSYMRLNRAMPMGLGILPPVDANGIPSDGSILFGGFSAYSATQWNSHTNELVNFYARGAGAELFDDYGDPAKKGWYPSTAKNIIDQTHLFQVMLTAATRSTNPAKNIIFWIPDGMQKAHEVAYSRYRYGVDAGLPWDAWNVQDTASTVRKGCVATWDVTGYNQRCFTYPDPAAPTNKHTTAPLYSRDLIETNPDHASQMRYAKIGYDTTRGGETPNIFSDQDTQVQRAYLLTKLMAFGTRIEPNDASLSVGFTTTNDNNSLFLIQPNLTGGGHLVFQPATGMVGTAQVTATGSDMNGGTAVGSPLSRTFTINVSSLAAPTFSPATGLYTSAQNVTLSCTTTGASIHYTLDGSIPTTGSTTYSAAIPLSTTTVVKAIATSATAISPMSSAQYSIVAATPAVGVAAPTMSLAAGTYDSAQVVTLSCTTTAASIHYTLDGSTPSGASSTATGAVAITSTSTLRALAVKSGMGDSAVTSATYVLAAAAPTLTAGGSFSAPVTVSMACTTSGASIRYTLDGSTPTASATAYSTAITISSTTTVKAIAVKSGLDNSSVSSATYTISSGDSSHSSSNKCGSGSGLAALALGGLGLMLVTGRSRRQRRV